MPAPDTTPWDRAAAISAIRSAACRTITQRAPIPGGLTVRAVEPIVGAVAPRRLEPRARHTGRDCTDDACEASRTWQQIGQAGGVNCGEAVAAAACNYVAGPPYKALAPTCGQPFAWTRTSREPKIGDRGPCSGSGDRREHANRLRLAAAIAARDTQREAGQ